ncbi:MAG TPA: DNA polymerase III subunit beta [Chitinophagales bacterium]|nr:DNA polymerase III subunit beta [Chitinophagales bacterium]HLP50612.1 DNA polymerase III subunit beta [Chitinophagales bacterium]
MKFIVSTTTLLKSLQTISGVINTSSVLPILEDFLFEIKAGKMTVFATDLETSMSTELKVEAKDSGRIAIPARILLDTLKTLPEQPLTFKVDEKTFGVEITSETGRYKLSGENADDFPKIPQPEAVTEINIPASALSNAIAKTLFAVSSDDLRPAMTGVLFQVSPDGMTFVATDAHKLVKLARTDVKASKAAQFIVPKKALGLLKAALPVSDSGVNVSYNKSNAFFTFENTKLICRLIDANYPDYNAVIPQNNPNTLAINRLELQNAMRRISIYSNKTTYQVVLTIAGSELKISAQDLDFSNEATERLTCNYEGTDIEIGFNARFLIEMLGVLDSGEIEIELSTPTRAGVLRPTEKNDNEDLLMLVMPVMINS